MPLSSLVPVYAIYGLAFFTMGIAVAARVASHDHSPSRKQMWGLAGFGILHGAFEWLLMAEIIADASFHPVLKYGFATVSFLPLFAFAFPGRKTGLAVASAVFIGWIIGAGFIREPASIEFLTRYLVAMPAAAATGWAFLRAPALWRRRTRTPRTSFIAGLLFLIYAASQLVSSPTPSGIGPLMTTVQFEALFAFPVLWLRTFFALALIPALTAMLMAFDSRTRATLLLRADSAERESTAAHIRLSAVFDADPSCIKIMDRAGRVLTMNPAGLEILGAGSLDEVRGKRAVDLVHADDRVRFQKALDDAFSGQPSRVRFRLAAPVSHWMEQHAVPLFDPDDPGRVQHMLAVARDVTETVEYAGRLEQSQRIAKLGSWEHDLRSNRLHWSEEIYRIFEFDREQFEATYESFLEKVHPDDRDAVDAAFRSSLRSGRPYEVVHRLLLPDGRIKWVREIGETRFDDAGAPVASLGTVQDITRQKETEDALHQSEATMAAFLRVSPEAVIITDEHARITVFSAGAQAIFGYAPREVLGKPVECLMPEDFRATHAGHVAGFARSGETGRYMRDRRDIQGRRKNGETFPAQASLSKLATPAGVFFAVVLRDITQAKRDEKVLIQAKLAAEEASEAKTRFIANMSHELRTPLNAIIGFSEMLSEPAPYQLSEEKRTEYAQDIRDSGKHLLGVINDILEISRMDLDNVTLEEATTPLMPIVNSCIRMVSMRARDGDIAVVMDRVPDDIEVRVDPRLMSQALLNLLGNAVKFTEPGGHITVGTRPMNDGGVSLFVRDTGIGMPREDLDRITEPFTQLDNDLHRKFEGTGLGLAIVKRIAELHGAELAFESEPGRGTSAEIRIPAARVIAAVESLRRLG